MKRVFVQPGSPYAGSNKALIAYRNIVGIDNIYTTERWGANHQDAADGATWSGWETTGVNEAPYLRASSQDPVTVDYVALYYTPGSAAPQFDKLVVLSDGRQKAAIDYADLPDSGPVLVAIEPADITSIRVMFEGDIVSTPFVSVFAAGQLLQMQRTEYQGWTPPHLARQARRVPNVSDAGQYLGTTVTRVMSQASASWDHLDPGWYREQFDPFVRASETLPFFMAWRPEDFPGDLVYGWRTGDVSPKNDGQPDRMSVSMQMQAVTHG